MHGERKTRTETLNGVKLPFECVALLLQGGGALGAYQAGVQEALAERRIEPDWVAGISIGAINSAIIAGNAPEDRIAKLKAFWERVSDGGSPVGNWTGWTDWLQHALDPDHWRSHANRFAAGRAMFNGVPGFYDPRVPPPWAQPDGAPGATSWYDTAALKKTLLELVDFDRINRKEVRLSLGAVNVRTGNFEYFDTETHVIRPEHVMASGALPPAFAPVEIDGEHYWDGGVVSNTPLDWVLDSYPLLDTLVFQVDLWSARGALPKSLGEVAARAKEIQYSSRTRASTDRFKRLQKARGALIATLEHLAEEHHHREEVKYLKELADPCVYNIVQLIYRSPPWELESKDYEFSRATMQEHWRAGYEDASHALAHPDVLMRPSEAQAVNIYDYCTPRGRAAINAADRRCADAAE